MPDFLHCALLCLLVLVTYFQEAVTGFGCTVLALPFAILLLGGVAEAKPVLVMLALILNIGVAILGRKDISWRESGKILLMVLAGVPAGIWLAEALPEKWLKLILGVFMVAIGLNGLRTLGSGTAIKTSQRSRALASGFLPLGGIIHGAFGSGGPLVVIYATRALTDKSVFRVTLAMSFILINAALVSTWSVQHVITVRHVYLAAMCLPFTLTGLFVGDHVHYRMNETAFKRMVYSVLVAAGVALGWVAVAVR